jgi:hypothetical protein
MLEAAKFQRRKATQMFQPHNRSRALGSALMLFLAMSTVVSCTAQNNAPAPATAAPDAAAPTGSPTALAETTAPAALPAATPAATAAGPELCGPGSAIKFDRAAFQSSPKIDNKWYSLTPGMQYTTTGTVTKAEGAIERTVIHSVTGLTKMVDGVKTQVLWDRDYAAGELVESELAMFAQTESGDVWLFGEYPEEFENGEFIGAPNTFIAGISGAQAGIAMPGEPRIDTPSYVQANAPAVGFLDCGDVVTQTERVCVPAGCYDGALVIDERNPLEPAVGHQRKYYSAGTGLVKVTAVGGADQETLDLVKAEKLSDAQLKEINQQALALEQHAYEVSTGDYAKTQRAEIGTETSGGP